MSLIHTILNALFGTPEQEDARTMTDAELFARVQWDANDDQFNTAYSMEYDRRRAAPAAAPELRYSVA